MRRDKIIRFIIAPALLVMLFAGCVKRDLEVRPSGTDGYAEIALDWDGQTHPKSAHFLLYNESGELVKEAMGVTESFKGSLAAGTYRIVVCNEDAVNVDHRGLDNYATAEVFVLTKGAQLKSNRATPLIQEPRQVFGTGVFKEFEQLVIESNKTTTATVVPKLLTHEVQFFFKVKGSDEIRSLEGVVNGVCSGVFLANGVYNTASSYSLEFVTSPRSEATKVEFVANVGIFNLLTNSESAAGTNTINITLTEANNTEHSATFDLTEVLKEIIVNNGGVIPIEIPVEIVLEVRDLGGMTATVRPWDDSGSGGGNPRP